MSDFSRLTPLPGEQPDDPFGSFIDGLDMDEFTVVSSGDAIDPKAKQCIDDAITLYENLNSDPEMTMQFVPIEEEQAELMKGVIAHVRDVLSKLDGQTVNGLSMMIYAIGIYAISLNNYIDHYGDEGEDNVRF